MRWFGKRITYHWLTPPPPSRKRTKLTDLIRDFTRKGYKERADEIKKWAVTTCNTECLCGFQFVSGDSRFRSSANKSGVFHSLLSILHTDKAMELARRHKSLLRRMDVLFGIRGVV